MGNRIGRRRQVVDDKYTKPQGLYQHRDIDQRKLRKLILESKLAPCYPGDEEYALDLEECPICFLYYPSLNRSRCCEKGMCTECFLQMKPSNQSRAAQCPFCKTANYAVEYRGVKTKEEKSIEQIEEQKVIEAQIRVQQQELQDEVDKLKKRQSINSSGRIIVPAEVENHEMNTTLSPGQRNDIISSEVACSAQASARPSHSRQNRDDDFDLDLEDIMIMEAIWLSLQEQGAQANPVCSSSLLPEPSYSVECHNSEGITPKISSSGGLACAAAALAECRHLNGSKAPVFNMLQQPCIFPAGNARIVQNPPPDRWVEISLDDGREVVREQFAGCSTEHWSKVAEAGTSCAGSTIAAVDSGFAIVPFPESINIYSGNYIPDSFEDQMMLAMALSLAEAQAQTNSQGFSWP